MLTLAKAFRAVPEGVHYLIERNGKYLRTITPGMNFILPFFDRVGYKVDMRERKVRVKFPDLKTKDNAQIVCDADVYVQVTDAHKVAYATGNVDETLRLKAVLEMKKLVKSRTLAQILSSADQLDEEFLSHLKAHDQDWGLHINYVDIHKIYEAG